MRLYIIGNGFDIHHDMKSKYKHFKTYVKKHDPELFNSLVKYFNTVDLWSNFEKTLAQIDTNIITEEAEEYLISYGANKWREAYHHDYQYIIKSAINIVTNQLKEHFTNWILQLNIPSNEKMSLDLLFSV